MKIISTMKQMMYACMLMLAGAGAASPAKAQHQQGVDPSNAPSGRAALLLIETQNEWMHKDGKLRKKLVQDQAMLDESIKNIEQALAHARKIGMPVIHVGLRYQPGYPELANGQAGLRKAIPTLGTFPLGGFGAEFFESVKPQPGEFIVMGRTGSSGFAGSNLDVYLRSNGIDKLYLTGYATHVCVESTLREAHDKAYLGIVISDATAAFNRQQQNFSINETVHHFGEHMATEDFLKLR